MGAPGRCSSGCLWKHGGYTVDPNHLALELVGVGAAGLLQRSLEAVLERVGGGGRFDPLLAPSREPEPDLVQV